MQRKQELREAHKKKSLAGIKRACARADSDSDAEDPGEPPEAVGASQPEDEEDDAEYFRQAVGEEPDEGMQQGLLVTPWPALFICSEELKHFSPYRLVPHSGQAEMAGGASGQEAAREGAEAW